MNSNLHKLFNQKLIRQLINYTIIGLLTNFFGYSFYLLLTYYYNSPKFIMSLTYAICASLSFFANKEFTFNYKGSIKNTGFRYLITQILGYSLNFLLLFLLVDIYKYNHQIVQAVSIFIVAVFLFLLSRYFVFSKNSKN